MTIDENKEATGFKLRFGISAMERAEDVARTLIMPPLLEADDSLPADSVVLDVSYHDGEVDRDVDFSPYIA